MYSPPYNRVEDRQELVEFMRANSFALLVTATGGAPMASHLPVTVADGEGGLVIHSHMAKPNPQWQEFFEDEVLVETADGTRIKAVTAGGEEFPEGAAVGLDFAPRDLYLFHPDTTVTLCHGVDGG